MILFILEGKKREDYILKSVEYLFFPEIKNTIICSYGNNIYNLYKRLKADGEDIESLILPKLLKEKESGISEDTHISDFAEVFLFFDYDNQDQNSSDSKIDEMLDFFNDETDNGKLYISYPMIESIYYTKHLPDSNYYNYTYPLKPEEHFKTAAANFSAYKSFDFITFRTKKDKYNKIRVISPSPQKKDSAVANWKLLKEQNVHKANYICTGINSNPQSKDDVNQKNIFNFQKQKYIQPLKQIAVLNSFTLFLFDYF